MVPTLLIQYYVVLYTLWARNLVLFNRNINLVKYYRISCFIVYDNILSHWLRSLFQRFISYSKCLWSRTQCNQPEVVQVLRHSNSSCSLLHGYRYSENCPSTLYPPRTFVCPVVSTQNNSAAIRQPLCRRYLNKNLYAIKLLEKFN